VHAVADLFAGRHRGVRGSRGAGAAAPRALPSGLHWDDPTRSPDAGGLSVNPFASATELMADLRAGKITSSELTEAYIARIEKHDGRLNAVVERDFERARQQARAADQGGSGVLRGLPITLKESFNVAGLHTTCGVP